MKNKRPFKGGYKRIRVISARLSSELDDHVERYRDMHALSRADIVREALRHYFVGKQGRR